MVKITFVEADGEETVVDARADQTIMEAATKNGVRGIAADCGGNCACGTCRIYVDPSWRAAMGEISEIEKEMLEFSGDPEPGVRLSCRIGVIDALDGLVVRLPASQH